MVLKNLSMGYQNCNTSQIYIYISLVGMPSRDICIPNLLFGSITILINIDTRAILLRYQGSCTVYRSKWYQDKDTISYPYPTGIKICDILIIVTQMASNSRQYKTTTRYNIKTSKSSIFNLIQFVLCQSYGPWEVGSRKQEAVPNISVSEY
jgi:hypothetical protein